MKLRDVDRWFAQQKHPPLTFFLFSSPSTPLEAMDTFVWHIFVGHPVIKEAVPLLNTTLARFPKRERTNWWTEHRYFGEHGSKGLISYKLSNFCALGYAPTFWAYTLWLIFGHSLCLAPDFSCGKERPEENDLGGQRASSLGDPADQSWLTHAIKDWKHQWTKCLLISISYPDDVILILNLCAFSFFFHLVPLSSTCWSPEVAPVDVTGWRCHPVHSGKTNGATFSPINGTIPQWGGASWMIFQILP